MSDAERVRVSRGLDYGDGKLLDVYRPAAPGEPGPTVLLWHGVGPDERYVLAALATAVAARGLTVVTPDWRSDAPDGGRAHQRAALAYTRAAARAHQRAALAYTRAAARELGGLGEDAIVLAGWSRGGRSAAAVAVRPDEFGGWRPASVVCLGAAYTRLTPVTGGSPIEDLAACGAAPVPFWLVHGTEDTVVPVGASREWAALLRDKGWPVRLEEPTTDHAGVIGAEYDAAVERYVPATAAHAVAAGALSARMIAEAAGVRLP